MLGVGTATRDGPKRGAGAGAPIAAARLRPILFRELHPPPAEAGLSFYGGVPVGPAGMAWPHGENERPLTFIIQWDAAALAAQDATGLLPRDGALYLFCDLEWGRNLAFRFVHAPGDGSGWAPLTVPAQLGPVYGIEGSWLSALVSSSVPAERRDAPRLLPRWPFTPVAMDYPTAGEPDKTLYWIDRADVKEALIRAQDPSATPFPDDGIPRRPFGRPFPAFPHDWAAVRVMAGAVLKGVESPSGVDWQRFMPEVEEAARAPMAAAWRDEALALYDEATRHPAGAAVPKGRADAVWDWIEKVRASFGWRFDSKVWDAINASLGLQSEALAAIPAAGIAANARCHSLGYAWMREEYAHEFAKDRGLDLPRNEVFALHEDMKARGELKQVRDVFAPPPNRMFGPPSYVQGEVEDYVETWLLLLELTSSSSIGLQMGDGVLQFLIRPDDLRARRFDRVKMITTGY